MPSRTFDAYGYAGQVLLPALGLANHPFVVKSPGAAGTASRLFRVVVERGPDLLVRVYESRARALRNLAALRFLERHDLPAPRLRYDDTAPANLLLRGEGLPRWATTETWIDGVPAVDVPEKEREKITMMVAAVLARYHAVTRGRWGRPGALSDPRPFHAQTLGTAARMLRDLAARGVLAHGAAEGALERYAKWRRSLMKIGTFQLIHRDANRRNFILPAEKGASAVIPVDLHRLGFGVAAEDVADALHHFCRSDRALARRFLERYLADAAPTSRTAWERAGSFFVALNALKRLHKRTDPDAPDRLAAGDPRAGAWSEEALSLPAPPLVWPEPGSAPPEEPESRAA